MTAKRLTDEEFRAERFGRGERTGEEMLADHLQAREDVRALAKRLRDATGGHDTGCSFYRMNFGPPKCDCATGRLLSEIDR